MGLQDITFLIDGKAKYYYILKVSSVYSYPCVVNLMWREHNKNNLQQEQMICLIFLNRYRDTESECKF